MDVSGRARLICPPSSRTGENPPYGMIGRIEETSASFEARSAPRSYPTVSEVEQRSNAPSCASRYLGMHLCVRRMCLVPPTLT